MNSRCIACSENDKLLPLQCGDSLLLAYHFLQSNVQQLNCIVPVVFHKDFPYDLSWSHPVPTGALAYPYADELGTVVERAIEVMCATMQEIVFLEAASKILGTSVET